MLVGGCVDELDLGGELAPILFVSEGVECVFVCDVPLDGCVGAGGSYGLDLVLGFVDESFLDAFQFSCHWVGPVSAFWFPRPVSLDEWVVAGAFGVDEGEAVEAVELDAVDDVGVLDGDAGDLLLVAAGRERSRAR